MLLPRVFRRTLKIVLWVALVCILGLTGLVASVWIDHNRETTLPVPSGPFAVGRMTYLWTDDSHVDPLAPQAGTKRKLAAWIWYPAEHSVVQGPDVPRPSNDYLPVPWRRAVEQQWGLNRWLMRDLSKVRAHSIQGARMSPAQPEYPVILMRGGLAA